MPKIKLNNLERIYVAGIMIEGISLLDEGYKNMLRPDSQATAESIHKMAIRWWQSPRVKEHRREVRLKLEKRNIFVHDNDALNPLALPDAAPPTKEEEESEDRATRALVISELKKALTQAEKPSDRAQISIKLAEMVGVKGRKEEEEKNRRHFYLPFISHCRTCPLMLAALELRAQTDEDSNPQPTKKRRRSNTNWK